MSKRINEISLKGEGRSVDEEKHYYFKKKTLNILSSLKVIYRYIGFFFPSFKDKYIYIYMYVYIYIEYFCNIRVYRNDLSV